MRYTILFEEMTYNDQIVSFLRFLFEISKIVLYPVLLLHSVTKCSLLMFHFALDILLNGEVNAIIYWSEIEKQFGLVSSLIWFNS